MHKLKTLENRQLSTFLLTVGEFDCVFSDVSYHISQTLQNNMAEISR